MTSEGDVDDGRLFFCNPMLSKSAIGDLGRPGDVNDDDGDEDEDDRGAGAAKYDNGAGNLSSTGMNPSRYPPNPPVVIPVAPNDVPLRLKELEDDGSWKYRLRQSNSDVVPERVEG